MLNISPVFVLDGGAGLRDGSGPAGTPADDGRLLDAYSQAVTHVVETSIEIEYIRRGAFERTP